MKHSLIALIVATMTGLSMLPAAEAAQWRRAHDTDARPAHGGERHQERHGRRGHDRHYDRHGRGHGRHHGHHGHSHGHYGHSYYGRHHRHGRRYGHYRSPVVVLPPPPLLFPLPVVKWSHRHGH